MKIKSKTSVALARFRSKIMVKSLGVLSILAVSLVLLTPSVTRAATQMFTNAPANAYWTNGLNWIQGAYPGALNMTGNTVNGDIAIFTNPIAGGGIGSAANPVLVGDATIVPDRSLQVSGLTFDGTNCGAYVIAGDTPPVWSSGAAGQPAELGILNVSHNGAIRMNAPVTNIETITCPVLTRLPSSTQGVFNFINNAVNTNGIFVIYSVTNDSASSRGTEFVLDGTNFGTNTIYSLSAGPGASAANWIQKQGLGTWVLTGNNIFGTSAPHVVNNGMLVLQNAGAFGSANKATVTSNAVVRIDAVNVTNTFSMQLTGTVRVNGSATLSEFSIANTTGTAPKLATTSANDVMTVGTASGAVSGGSSSSTVHIAGPGTVLLSQSDTYAGNWSVDSGTNQLSNATALGSGPNLNIAAGAVFDVTPLTAGSGTYALSTAGISGTGTGTVVGSTAATINADPSGIIDLSGGKNISTTITPVSFSGDLTHPALYVANGTLKLANNGFSIVNNTGTPLGTGTYTLVQQASGNITDGGGYSVVSVSGGGLAAGDVGSIVVSGGSVNLVVAPYTPKNLVWTGGAANANWDVNADANFLNGASASVFNNADNVLFNFVGSSNPVVTLVGTLAPGSVVINSTVTNWAFTGSGSIAGLTSLVKMGPSNLLLQTVNTYSGGTIVSNGVLQVGVANAIPDGPAGDVTVYGTIDMNGFSDAINGLNGTGVVDTVSGGTPVLSIGNNNDNGTFSGNIQNTAGTLAVTMNGTGTETLSGNNTYAGATTINNGTLSAASYNALGSGASAVTVNIGTLDIRTNVIVNTLSGSGTVANNFTTSTNTLIVTNTSTFNGIIADGSGGGGVALLVAGGTFRFNGASTYSGGTIVESGTTLAVGPTPGKAGTGLIIASNNATVSSASTSGTSSQIDNNIRTVSGATINLVGGGTSGGDGFNGQFFGDATTTNIFHGTLTLGGGNSQFTNFFGTARILPGVQGNRLNGSGGGENTTFDFEGGNIFNHTATAFALGAVEGGDAQLNNGGGLVGPSVGPATFSIGAKNSNCSFEGFISGNNNIIKVGTGTLRLDGQVGPVVTSPDGGLTFVTNYVPVNNLITYAGFTTVSNGTLQIIAPISLTNSPTVTLSSSTAVLDASQTGYINTDGSTFTNVVTNGVWEVIAAQTNSGIGTIKATNVLVDAGAVLNVGQPTGLLTINDTYGITLAGAVNMFINASNGANSELSAPSFTVSSGATLSITNIGTNYPAGATVYHLFNSAINTNNFASIALPTVTSPVVLSNWLSLNGTLVVVAPASVNTNPTNITFSVSGSTLTLSWPADHKGWHLQIQTNTLATGLGTNWITLPGSDQVNSTNLTVNPANGSVFYRMTYP